MKLWKILIIALIAGMAAAIVSFGVGGEPAWYGILAAIGAGIGTAIRDSHQQPR